jgi:hypothetical protein
MKTRIIFTVLLAVFVAVFIFTKPKAKENAVTTSVSIPTDTIFKICAFDNGSVQNDYTNLHDIGINTWHKYSDIASGWIYAGVSGDIRETQGPEYTANVDIKINQNYGNGFISVLDRCKINYLGLAKRSVYECESETNNLPDPDYWFYRYNTHGTNVSEEYHDITNFGNGIYVRHSSSALGHTAGYVVKDVMTNREQLWLTYYKDMKWYVLPRIRIDTTGYFNLDTTRVCKIDILKSDSSIAKSVILRKSSFAVNNYTYNGQYINHFFDLDSQKTIPITFDSLGVINPYPGKSLSDLTCGVDYRIFWYGECEMWVDNVIVENQIAYDFFHDNPDKTHYQAYQKWLDWIVPQIAQQGNIYSIYEDGFEFCHLPVLEKLNYEIKRRSNNNIELMSSVSYSMLKAHLPDYENQDFSPLQFKEFLFNKTGISNFKVDKYYADNL